LVRQGSTIGGYYSTNGTNWTFVSSSTVAMVDPATAGLAIASQDNAFLELATFDHVALTGGIVVPPPSTTPARPKGLRIR